MTLTALVAACALNVVALEPKADVAWNRVMDVFWCPKTSMIYDYVTLGADGRESSTAHLPTPEEIAIQFPNPNAWSAGMEDCVLKGSPMLLAALERLKVHGGNDPAARDVVEKVYAGLRRCATVSGVPGFVARSASPVDGKSYFYNSSIDQYTLFTYTLWRYYGSGYADEARKAEIRAMLTDVAKFVQRCLSDPAADMTLLRADGKPADVSRLWGHDMKTKISDEDGTFFNFGGVCPHEIMRAPMMLAAAWSVTGDVRWRDEMRRYAADAIRIALTPFTMKLYPFALYQAQVSHRLLWEVETDPTLKAGYARVLERFGNLAAGRLADLEREMADIPAGEVTRPIRPWRTVTMLYRKQHLISGRAYMVPDIPWYNAVRNIGEDLAIPILVRRMMPSGSVPQDEAAHFCRLFGSIDWSRYPTSSMTHSLLAYWVLRECADLPWIGDGLPERTDGADWYEEDPAPEFRATFVPPAGAKKVTVRFVCPCFGSFSVGSATPMNSDGIDTFWSVYDKTVYSRTFEVDVVPGENEVRVRLGNGFWNLPPLRFWGGGHCPRLKLPQGRPCFKFAVDGVAEPLKWTWRRTNVIRNSVYMGADVDATRPEDTVWKPAVPVKGPKGEIVEWPNANPQMAVQDVRRGTATWLGKGADHRAKVMGVMDGKPRTTTVQVVDFGVNASGLPAFTFENEARGTAIEIVYGERLNADGSVNFLTQTAGQIKDGNGGPGSPYFACQRDSYVCRGRDDVFRPPFTWHIFRYAEIRGAKNLVKDPTQLVRSMVSLRDDAARVDARFQGIHELCRRAFQANMIGGIQSDCPGRERLGYGGDIVASCEAMILNFGMKEIYLKILRDFADEAADDGWLTETAPYVGIGDFMGLGKGGKGRGGPISWSVGVPVVMDALMRHYPDTKDRVLAFYPTCARYVRLVDGRFPSGIIPKCIGDHEAIERAPDEVTATAHWHEFVRLTIKFAKMLGREDDVAAFGAIEKKILAAFQAKHVKDGVVANGSQSAQAIALYLGLVPSNQVAAAEKRLVAAIEEKDCAPQTGIFGTRYMLMYLSEHGRRDLAEKIVLHKGFPGFLHMLDRGATTLWETWAESDDTYSNCHPMFGSVDEWILKYGRGAALRMKDVSTASPN